MCDCNKTNGFAQAMQNAKKIETKTGVKQAVYLNKSNGLVYFGAETAVKKLNHICCYYRASDGKEITLPIKEEKKVKKTEKVEKTVKKTDE